MKETIAISIANLIFLVVSYVIHGALMKANSFVFILLCISQFIFGFVLFSGAVYLHQYFRKHGVVLEFGHAEEVLVEFFLLWMILSLANIVIVGIRLRYFKKAF